MRFTRIKIKDLGPFHDVDLDLSSVPGALIAVTGDNGEGKSTLLELLPGAWYRACPTRGSLMDLATSRSAAVEVSAVNGKAYTIRQTADAVSGKSESLILDESGASVLETAKVTEADAWVGVHFPLPKVLYSSSFMAQASAGFVDLSAADRKRVLLRLIQIERLEAMALRARERARTTKGLCDTTAAKLSECRKRYPTLASATEGHAAAERELASASQRLQEAQTQLERARVHAEVERARAPLVARVKDLRDEHTALQARIAHNRRLMAREEVITAAQARMTTATAEIAAHDGTLKVARSVVEEAKRAVAKTAAAQRAADVRASTASDRVSAASARMRDGKAITAAIKQLPTARKDHDKAKLAIAEHETAIAGLEKSLLGGKDARIGGLRGGLETIQGRAKRGVVKSAALVAADTLTADDALHAEAASAPAALKRKRAQLELAWAKCEDLAETVSKLRALVARAKDLDAAQAEATAAKEALKAALAERAEVLTQAAQVTAELADSEAELRRLMKDGAALAKTLQTAKEGAADFLELQAAKARLEELQPHLARTASQIAAAVSELAEMEPADAGVIWNVPEAQEELRRRTENEQTARATLARNVACLESAHTGVAACAELESGLAKHQSVHADWTRLGQDLGQDGLQALEIDAAIPQLNTLTNDLLHTCHGARFTVEVRTDRLSSDGKRQLEDLDIVVLDTVKGRHAPIETYSGGERVILGEALALALTMLACQRAGLTAPTLVRDESGAALDPENGRAYIAMLRRAAAVLHADKVLFVTHNPELQALADAAIVVSGGTAVLRDRAEVLA